MPVVDVRVDDDVQKLARHHARDLRHHHEQDRVLADVPVVSREDVLAALHEAHVEGRLLVSFSMCHVVRHAVGAGVQVHLREVGKGVHVGHDAARERRVRKVVEHAVHLVEVALGIVTLLGDLVAVRLADGTGLIGPLVPDMALEVVDVVRLLLIDPEDLVHSGLKCRAAKRECRKLLTQVVARRHAEVLDGVGGRSVLPMGTDLLTFCGGAVVEDVAAHLHKLDVGLAHAKAPPYLNRSRSQRPASSSQRLSRTGPVTSKCGRG